jgi:hypothetical protein
MILTPNSNVRIAGPPDVETPGYANEALPGLNTPRRPSATVILSEAPQRAAEKSLVHWSRISSRHKSERDFSTALEMTVLLRRIASSK